MGVSQSATLDEGDARADFAKDRDRLLYTSSFRRLSGKSQVVASLELGSFHTRLTHSLKVAQLGRRVAERIQRSRIDVVANVAAPDADLIEFACLAHDLGHPPFGHAGESALQEALDASLRGRFAARQQPEGKVLENQRIELGSFEGNPQSLRIVTRLAHKWLPSDGETGSEISDWFGLNLCAASIDSITKYPWTRVRENQPKWGCYGTEGSAASPGDEPILQWARTATGANPVLGEDAVPSFEAQVMNWCDDVAYAVHDVEDFFEAGLIPLESLFGANLESEDWEKFRDGVVLKWSNKPSSPTYRGARVTAEILDFARSELLRNVPTSVAAGAFHGSNLERRHAHRRTSGLIGYFLRNVSFEGEPCLHNGRLTIGATSDESDLLIIQCDMLKELIWTYVINSASLASQQSGQRKIIFDLFDALSQPNGDQLLPIHFREYLEDPLPRVGYETPILARLRVVSDYISSLTEIQAYALHRRITGIDPGGLRDLL